MDIIPEIHRRLRKMFLLESGTPKATGDGPAMTEVTAGILIDVVKAVGDFFKEHDDGKVFRGWVDKQQARGWVLADLRGCPLLEPGTARAEKGTARGVGNEIAKEAGVQAPKVSQAGKDARKRVRTQSDAPAATRTSMLRPRRLASELAASRPRTWGFQWSSCAAWSPPSPLPLRRDGVLSVPGAPLALRRRLCM